ncbi:MAG: YraN family protein [Alphaproteobacteria bacterium]|nr:YraN family protein [Alphaproteobacteria bacterium]
MRPDTNHKTGHRMERLALLFLMLKGYRPVARNYVVGRGTGAGEVDLIVRRGRTLVFVEVKYRPSLTQAVQAITAENQIRVARASAAFIARNPRWRGHAVRYDAVLMAPRRWPRHLAGAWRVM